MPYETRVMAHDSVCKLEQSSDLFRSLNTLRVEPNAPNPFVVAQNSQQPAPAQTNTEDRK
jgi:hypothetical protein